MADPVTKVTIATSTGAIWWTLIFHFAAGLVGLLTGAIALAVNKGGETHKRIGMAFTYAMLASGFTACIISAYSGQSTVSGLVTVYFVFTAMATVRPLPFGRKLDIAAMLIGATMATFTLLAAWEAWHMPRKVLGGVPFGMFLFLGTMLLLGAIGDVRVLIAGGITGARRLARHLWRMCFGLFIATGSFFLGQMKFLPEPVRILPLLLLLAFAPLLILLYWMWRVRLRQQLKGLIVSRASVA